MRFSIKNVTKSGRIGCISDLEKFPGQTVETPVLFMHTRGGNIPHITHDVLQMVSTEFLFMQMPLCTLTGVFDNITGFGRSLSEFVGLKEYPNYITPQDPGATTPSGFNVKYDVALWANQGKVSVDPHRYMELIEIMKPDMYLAPCDGDTNSSSTRKRVSKSLLRSSKMLKICLDYHANSKVLKDTFVLGAVEGGYDVKSREVAAKSMKELPVNGYVIDGLHNNGPEAEDISFKTIQPLITSCLDILPEEKMRVIHGAWTPDTVLKLVAAGFDVFDASLAYLSTERGAALTFPFRKAGESNPETVLTNGEVNSAESDRKPYEMYLSDKIYFDQFSPLLPDCTCLACCKHTRAYIHHLLNTKELLAKVLLMIHNVHHYLEFFKQIRKAIQTGTLDQLQLLVASKS